MRVNRRLSEGEDSDEPQASLCMMPLSIPSDTCSCCHELHVRLQLSATSPLGAVTVTAEVKERSLGSNSDLITGTGLKVAFTCTAAQVSRCGWYCALLPSFTHRAVQHCCAEQHAALDVRSVLPVPCHNYSLPQAAGQTEHSKNFPLHCHTQ